MAGDNTDYQDGFFYWSNNAEIFLDDGSTKVDLLKGYFPASISGEDGDTVNSNYRNFWVYGRPFSFNQSVSPTWGFSSLYVDVLFAVPAPLTVSVSGVSTGFSANVQGALQLLGVDSDGSYVYNGETSYASRIDSIFDNTFVLTSGSSPNFKVVSDSYDVEHYFGFRYYFDSFSDVKGLKRESWLLCLQSNFNGKYSFSDPDYVHGIFNEVTVNTGILQEINGTLTEIQTSTTQISSDISDIKDTVTDTSEQLQDSNSNIWQAAGSAISGAIESLFVPSESDIADVKQGFDDLAEEKLGGAYTAMETVEDTVSQVNDKLNNPSAAEGVEFPGIAVPLGGDVGTVVLAERQMVTLPTQLTVILHPIAGTIISIICGLGTFNVLKDMVECFLSGFSYAAYLHRNKGGSDE